MFSGRRTFSPSSGPACAFRLGRLARTATGSQFVWHGAGAPSLDRGRCSFVEEGSSRLNARLSLSQRLFLLTGVALLPAILIVTSTEISSRRVREADAQGYVARMSDLAASEIERALTSAATLMIAVAAAPPVTRRDSEGCETYVQEVNRQLPQLNDIIVADEEGTIFCHTGATPDAALPAVADPLIAELSGSRFAIGTYQDTPAGPSLPIGMAVRAESEVFVLLGISLTALEEVIYDSGFEVGTEMTIADRNGTILAHRPFQSNIVGKELSEGAATLAASGSRGTASLPGRNGRDLFVGYQPPVERRPFYISVGLPKDQVMAPVNAATRRSAFLALAGGAIAFLMAWVFGRVFVRRPVQSLVRTIRRWQSGNRNVRTGALERTSELGLIGATLDHLLDELQEREEAQRRAEGQRDVLARELEHRVKNLLSVVQAIARRTFSDGIELPEARRTFQERLNVLAKAQTVLTSKQRSETTIAEAVRSAYEPFAELDAGQIAVSGPDMPLDPETNLALSMALHELFTNAMKYGALSVSDGRVSIEWDVQDAKTSENLHLQWSEHDGPPVVSPEKAGFGTIMIKQMLETETGGKVSVDYDPAGLLCEIQLPVKRGVQPDRI